MLTNMVSLFIRENFPYCNDIDNRTQSLQKRTFFAVQQIHSTQTTTTTHVRISL